MTGISASMPAAPGTTKTRIARMLTALETSPEDPDLIAALDAAFRSSSGFVLGLTGPPGVGKSTLTNSIVLHLRAQSETVAVIAIDPSSQRSRGALLGDRMRLSTDPEDTGVFVRSMAARQQLGGLADVTFPAATLLRSLFDWVIVETVGVGQSETDIANCADAVVFCAQPASGDALQFMKSGIMEIPDMILVNKADLGVVAQRTVTDLKGALSIASMAKPAPDVVPVSAARGDGIADTIGILKSLRDARCAGGRLRERREEQARHWIRSHLGTEFGRRGADAILARCGFETKELKNPFFDSFSMTCHGRKILEKLINTW